MALIICEECKKEVSDKSESCVHCGAPLKVASYESTEIKMKESSDFGILLVAMPLAAALLIWFWVGGMNLFQNPMSSLNLVGVATILITAAVAAIESHKAIKVSGGRKNAKDPITWFVFCTLLWIIGYPLYMYKRKHYGKKNLLIAGIFVAIIFVGSYFIMFSAISSQIEALRMMLR